PALPLLFPRSHAADHSCRHEPGGCPGCLAPLRPGHQAACQYALPPWPPCCSDAPPVDPPTRIIARLHEADLPPGLSVEEHPVSCGAASNCSTGGIYTDNSHHWQAFVASES